MKTKREIIHNLARKGGKTSTVCGRGTNRTNRDTTVTCGRCKLLAKFARVRKEK